MRSAEEKTACKVKKETKKAKAAGPKRKPGRPKGSKNKDKTTMVLTPELQRIQKMLEVLLKRWIVYCDRSIWPWMDISAIIRHFPWSASVGLQLISKLRWDAALWFPFDGNRRRCKYGKWVDYVHIPDKYLKSTTLKDGIQTCTYQAQLLHEDFPVPLNVVIIVKKNLTTQAWGHVILFSSDLELPCKNLVDYYSLRFQIEFRLWRSGRETVLGFRGLHECQPDRRDQCRQLIFVYGKSVSVVNVRFSTNCP